MWAFEQYLLIRWNKEIQNKFSQRISEMFYMELMKTSWNLNNFLGPY